jgi:hypothetical protein
MAAPDIFLKYSLCVGSSLLMLARSIFATLSIYLHPIILFSPEAAPTEVHKKGNKLHISPVTGFHRSQASVLLPPTAATMMENKRMSENSADKTV